MAFFHDLVAGVYSKESSEKEEIQKNLDDIDGPEEDYRLGVLVVAHGMPGQWNERVKAWFDNEIYLPVPAELCFLEYSPQYTVTNAIGKLEKQSVNRIIAIPLFICGNSSHTHEVYEALEDTKTDAEILCTGAMDNNSLVSEILTEHGLGLCKGDPYDPRDRYIKPEETTLIIYGHGDANEWLQNWVDLAEDLQGHIESNTTFHFKEVTYCFKGEGNLKSAVENAKGHPLVVPWMVARSSFSETEIRAEVGALILTGECEYDGAHLIDHPNTSEWVRMQYEDHENGTVWTNTNVTLHRF